MNNFINNIGYIANTGAKFCNGVISLVNPVAVAVFAGTHTVTRILLDPKKTNDSNKICKEITAIAIACLASSLFTASPAHTLLLSAGVLVSATAIACALAVAAFVFIIWLAPR